MITAYLDFEENIRTLDEKIRNLRINSTESDIAKQIEKLSEQADKALDRIYSSLSIWDVVQVARHPDRPHTLDYINLIFEDFTELFGDRRLSDDKAIIGGLADYNGTPVMIIGHEKGRETNDKISRNFGMPQPGGLRKAARLMKLAEKFNIPIITFIDTPGAYPGIEGEEQGQSEAIAHNLALMSHLETPIISIVIGEGGSGGALALGVGDTLAMLKYSIFSVATPEACASIIWRDANKAEEAATAMKVTASLLHDAKIADELIAEPIGGAHRNHLKAAENVKKFIGEQLDKFTKIDIDTLVTRRYDKIMSYGKIEATPSS